MSATAPMPQGEQEIWLTTAKAMEYTGLSRSGLLRAAAKYGFRKQNTREGASTKTHYLESDLARYKQHSEAGIPFTAVQQEPGELTNLERITGRPETALQRTGNGSTFQAQQDFWQSLAARIAPQKPKLFVTVEEASKLSGLPRTWLRAKVKDGWIGKDFGPGNGRRTHYLIGMGELEALSRGEM
jgi:hypothetical protein